MSRYAIDSMYWMEKRILHLYHITTKREREYKYPKTYQVKMIGWLPKDWNDDLLQSNLREIWTYQKIGERSPRFRQWMKIDDGTWQKGLDYVPSSEYLLDGWRPHLNYHMVDHIKKLHSYTSDQVYVSSDEIENLKYMTAMGVHLT